MIQCSQGKNALSIIPVSGFPDPVSGSPGKIKFLKIQYPPTPLLYCMDPARSSAAYIIHNDVHNEVQNKKLIFKKGGGGGRGGWGVVWWGRVC